MDRARRSPDGAPGDSSLVSGARLALNPTDRLLAAYVALVTAVIVARGPFDDGRGWLLVAHSLMALMWVLFTHLDRRHMVGGLLHDFYPIVFLAVFYGEIGVLNDAVGLSTILSHDATVQGWEEIAFGGQISYTWIRNAPSVFWSGLLHLAYFSYYPIVILGAPLIAWRCGRVVGRQVVFSMMLAFVACYVVFVLYPVAGPNYAFPHPTGPVRDVWSARLVYGTLAGGSSVGAAFPSSHVAATVAVVIGTWRAWKGLGIGFAVGCTLMVVATVYCQMHYGLDATAGLAVGVAAGLGANALSGPLRGRVRSPQETWPSSPPP